jgi:hypothetical protein
MSRAHPAVVVGLVVVLIASGIAAAAHTQAVSRHDTTSDLSSATTLENVSVSAGAVRFDGAVDETVDGFEDGDISEWSGDTSRFSASTDHAHSGSFGLKAAGSDSFDPRLSRPVAAQERPGTVSVWHYQDALNDVGEVTWRNNGVEGVNILIEGDGSVGVFESGQFQATDTGIDVTAGTWYQLHADIDWAAETFTLTVRDDSGVVGTAAGLQFRNSISDIDTVRVESKFGDKDRYWDDFAYSYDTQSGVYVSDRHQLSNVQTGYVDLTTVQDASAEITWQGRQGGGWTDEATQTVTTAGNYSTDLSTEQYPEWRVRVDMTATGADPQVTLTTEGVAAATAAPSVDNAAASPQGKTVTSAPTLSIPVADADFATTQGDTVDVTFRVDGTPVHSETINSNQTVSYAPGTVTGTTNWSVRVADNYGHTTTSQQFSFTVPSTLTVHNVSEPRPQLSAADIEVRLFQEASDTVFERTASGGDIELEGVEAGADYFVKADAPGYFQRRTLLKGIFEQRRIYLLNKSAPAATVAFQIEDRTGNFGAGSTIQLERALNTSDTPAGESRYQVVASGRRGRRAGQQTRVRHDA